MHVVAANVGMGAAIASVKGKGAGSLSDSPLDHIGWEEDAVILLFEAMIEQALAQVGAADFHTHFGQDTFGFGEDLVDEVGGEDVEGWTHND